MDGKWLAFVDEQSVVICNVHTEEIVPRHDVEFQHRYDRLRVWGFHPRTNQLLFTYMKYVPLNPYQVTGYFWSLDEAAPVPCFEKTGDIIDLEFHPSGEEIWCNSGVIVERIDLQDGALLSQFYPQHYNVLAIRFCPQHGLVAFAGESQIVSIFSADGSERIVDLEAHTDTVFGVAWNSPHKRLATGSADGTVIIWDTETWKQAAQFQLDGEVGNLDWGIEGRVLMCSTNGAIYLWDATRGFERSKR